MSVPDYMSKVDRRSTGSDLLLHPAPASLSTTTFETVSSATELVGQQTLYIYERRHPRLVL